MDEHTTISVYYMRSFLLRALYMCGTCAWLICGLHAEAALDFQGLGDLPGGTFESLPRYLSPDGKTVLGISSSGPSFSSFIWTEDGGMMEASIFPSGDFSSGSLMTITSDHTVIIGAGQSSFGSEAYRWVSGIGVSGLGDLPGGVFRSTPAAMSSDGSVIVGKGTIGPDTFSDIEAFVWTAAGGMVGLGDLPGGSHWSQATDVSADGTVVVGLGIDDYIPVGSPEPVDRIRLFRWTQTSGMVDLGIPSGGDTSIIDPRISADGNVIIANFHDGLGLTDPFRWTQSTGLVLLNKPVGGERLSRVVDLSADGSVVTGWTFTDDGPQAVIWDDLHGPRYLADILTDLGMDLTGWTLETATGISDDGLTIVGTGINPDGNTEAFIARLPEPGAAVLLGVLWGGWVGRRARRRSLISNF